MDIVRDSMGIEPDRIPSFSAWAGDIKRAGLGPLRPRAVQPEGRKKRQQGDGRNLQRCLVRHTPPFR